MKLLKSLIAGLALAATISVAAHARDLVVYTSLPIPVVEKVQEIAKDKLGITIGVINGSSGGMLRRIEAEAAKPAADFFWASSANTMKAFEAYFEPYASPELSAMREEFLYPGGDIFQPVQINLVAVMANEDYLDGRPIPTSWADLAKPEWKGKITMANPESSSTGYTIIWGLSKLLDEATYKAIIANTVVVESARAVPKSVADGEYVIGLTFEASPYDYVANGMDEIKIIYPSEGTFFTPEYVGLVKGIEDKEEVQKAIDLLLSKDMQTELLKLAGRRPTRKDINVSEHIDLPDFSDLAIFATDETEAANARESFLAEWRDLPKGN